MAWRSLAAAVMACCLATVAHCPAAEETAEPSVRYLPLDAPAGMSQAVVVQGLPLVYTRQLLPLDATGKLVGEGSADKQIEQVLDNLDAVLGAAGSGLDKLVRVNVCALSHETANRLREHLAKRLRPAVRPAMTVVLTPLARRKALVAVDAVAVAAADAWPGSSAASPRKANQLGTHFVRPQAPGQAVALQRCEAVAGDKDCADAAVIPPGGVAYLSGQPESGGLAESAVAKSLSTLLERLGQLKLSPAQVVQVKVFLTPASSADEALGEVKRLFPGQLTPPVVFVEWIASAPVEIELVAQLPLTDKSAETIQYYNPPEVKPSPAFSRVALVRTQRQIYVSGLSARAAGDGEAQVRDVFAQIQQILSATGSDLQHLAKATYYVSDDDAGRAFDKLRPEFFAPERPPAASKVTVHGVGQAERTLTMDMIAVGTER
jgi:enamine deaminase RidA (YjgF/YER057c/UK114 family)